MGRVTSDRTINKNTEFGLRAALKHCRRLQICKFALRLIFSKKWVLVEELNEKEQVALTRSLRWSSLRINDGLTYLRSFAAQRSMFGCMMTFPCSRLVFLCYSSSGSYQRAAWTRNQLVNEVARCSFFSPRLPYASLNRVPWSIQSRIKDAIRII